MFRFVRRVDLDEIIRKQRGKEFTRSEQAHAGKTYYKLSPPKDREFPGPRFFFAPDERTIVFVEREEFLRRLLSAKGAEGPLAEALRRADMSNDVVAVVVTQPVQALVAGLCERLADDGRSEFRDLESLAGGVKQATIVANLFGDPFATATVETDSPETAAKLLPMAQKGRDLLIQAFQAERERTPKRESERREIESAMDDLGVQSLGSLSISQRGRELQAVVRLKMPELSVACFRALIQGYEAGRIRATRAQLAEIKTALQLYRTEWGDYPPSLETLLQPAQTRDGRMLGGAWVERMPLDPWNHPYNYMWPGQHRPDLPDIWSNGPDGIPNTADDIGNWQEP